MPLLEDLKEFFFLNLNDYSNIEISFPIGIFLILITVALCVFAFLYAYRRIIIVGVLKQLLRHDATNEENAKTLSKLHVHDGFLLKNMLSKTSGQLKSIVCRKGETKMTYEQYLILSKAKGYKEEKIDFSCAEFYINPEKLDDAKKIVESESPSMIKPLLMSILLLVLLLCVSLTLPQLLDYINNSIGK